MLSYASKPKKQKLKSCTIPCLEMACNPSWKGTGFGIRMHVWKQIGRDLPFTGLSMYTAMVKYPSG